MSHIRGNLVAFEIGNEPDLYPGDVRPADYTVADYVREWREYADAISQHVLKENVYGLDEWRIFQALTFVFHMNGFSTWVSVLFFLLLNYSVLGLTWNRTQAFEDGIDENGHVKLVSWHQYVSPVCILFTCGV